MSALRPTPAPRSTCDVAGSRRRSTGIADLIGSSSAMLANALVVQQALDRFTNRARYRCQRRSRHRKNDVAGSSADTRRVTRSSLVGQRRRSRPDRDRSVFVDVRRCVRTHRRRPESASVALNAIAVMTRQQSPSRLRRASFMPPAPRSSPESSPPAPPLPC